MSDEEAYEIHLTFHRLWTRDAARGVGYVKDDWKRLEAFVYEGIRMRGARPGFIGRMIEKAGSKI